MYRSDETEPYRPATTWAAAREEAALMPFERVLEFEEHGWPTEAGLLKRAFWSRPDIPTDLREGEPSGLPDPRELLREEEIDRGDLLRMAAEREEAIANRDAARIMWLADRV